MRVAVVGGGLAGLAAACELADRGCAVTLFERRPWAGGKTYSFRERETGEEVDNGQHVFMACTTAYVEFLRRLGTLHLTRHQHRLRVHVYDAAGRRSDLRAAPLPPPLHLAPSLLAYRHLPLGDRLRLARAVRRMAAMSEGERRALDAVSFGGWLREHGQSARAIRDLWDLIVVPTLNCRSDGASAAAALFVFREGFLKSSNASAIGIPRVGLSQLHVEPALRYIEARGGRVRLGCAVERFEVGRAGVEALVLASGERERFDAYLSALSHRQLLEALPEAVRAQPPFGGLAWLGTAPIVNLHLWFDRPVASFDFATFAGSELQWVFNRTRIAGEDERSGQHLVVSLSAAQRYMELTKEELRARFVPLLQRALSAAREVEPARVAVVKEPEATFLPAPGSEALRPDSHTPLRNLFLAGAWTATGWPATMESAVRSGLAAAQAALAMPEPVASDAVAVA